MTNKEFYFDFDYCEATDKYFPTIYNAQLTCTYLKFLKHYAYI